MSGMRTIIVEPRQKKYQNKVMSAGSTTQVPSSSSSDSDLVFSGRDDSDSSDCTCDIDK